MGGTIVFIIGILLILAGIGFALAASREGEGGAAVFAFIAGLVLGIGCIVGSMLTVVDAKKVGVVTSWKRPTGEIRTSGAGLIAPWESVTEMDAANQVDPYKFDVQLSGGARATLEIFPSWQMANNAAPELFKDFKSFEGVENSLFKQQLIATANNIFGTYNPLTNVDPKTGELKKTKVQWATELKTALEQNPLINGKLIINNISIPTILPDENTQKNLDLIVAEFAKGSVLEQMSNNADKEKAIAEKQALIPDKLFCMRENSKNGLDAGTCLGGNSIIVDSRRK